MDYGQAIKDNWPGWLPFWVLAACDDCYIVFEHDLLSSSSLESCIWVSHGKWLSSVGC